MSRWTRGAVALLALLGACVFAPDFSRYPVCDASGGCPAGFTCLAPEGVCLPDCGASGPCPLEVPPAPDGGPSLEDAGGRPGPDAGPDAGGDGGAPSTDAGTGDAGESGTPLVLAPEPPPDGVTAEGYTFTFQVQGGTPPYRFSTPDALPPGLVLDAQGVLSGTPWAPGDTPFLLEVRDQGTPTPRSARLSVTVRVHPPLRVAGPVILADFPSGKAYEERVSALGGRPPYTFELLPGNALPAGLALYETGAVRGTSSASGAPSSFEVRVRDSARPPRTTTRALQLTSSVCTTTNPCPRTRALPDARAGEPYSYTLQANTSTASPTWSVEKGPLPPGLQLSPEGLLSGTPTQAGNVELTLAISEWLGTVLGSRSITLTLKVY